MRIHADDTRAFWCATALQVAGRSDEAVDIFRGLQRSDDRFVRFASGERLASPLNPLDEAILSEGDFRLLDRLDAELADELRYSHVGAGARRRPVVTWGLVALSSLAFCLEMPGGTTDARNLVKLGALALPIEHFGGMWWRVLTAGFLHFGSLHLLLNLVGLWFFGRYMERVWGRWRMLVCYLASTFGANLIAVMFITTTLDNPVVMVGASSGVMGILGASVGFVGVEWWRKRVRILRRQLFFFGAILSLQMVFDIATPVVSSTLHISGLGIGLALGIILAMAEKPSGD